MTRLIVALACITLGLVGLAFMVAEAVPSYEPVPLVIRPAAGLPRNAVTWEGSTADRELTLQCPAGTTSVIDGFDLIDDGRTILSVRRDECTGRWVVVPAECEVVR